MQLTIDSLGEPIRGFEALRDELIGVGKKFDAESLAHIPYEKLAWCCLGLAGKAACSLNLVQEEKLLRRYRFLSMAEPEMQEVKTLLQIEQMDSDVARERTRLCAPKWEDIRLRQKAWFKLNCIANHLDNVFPRMIEVAALLGQVRDAHDLPPDFTSVQIKKIDNLTVAYPGVMSDSIFRIHIASIALEINKLMPEEEQRVCDAEVLFDYSCTSDCYRPLL
jgi:hypothetical protein